MVPSGLSWVGEKIVGIGVVGNHGRTIRRCLRCYGTTMRFRNYRCNHCQQQATERRPTTGLVMTRAKLLSF